jgi:6-phosphofructokinase 1
MDFMNEFGIKNLGPCHFESPLENLLDAEGHSFRFIQENERIMLQHRLTDLLKYREDLEEAPSLELAGPRKNIFFDPKETTIGIVTCGGLSPGLNNVIRDLVMSSSHLYGVKRIFGFRYGYRGIAEENLLVELNTRSVTDIQEQGGSILGSSRGDQDAGKMIDRLLALGINILYVLGGDGTMRGALTLCEEIAKRKLNISIIGIPKTIDNDFRFMDQSFGFDTAYAKAVEAIDGAHREAEGAPNGIGLVKLMGRHAGFIACAATLASNQVNFVLIPEVSFSLDGPNGFLEALHRRLLKRQHAVIVVAEGAGQELLKNAGTEKDASGNIKLIDIGLYLTDRIKDHFKKIKMEINLKYIDPSYIIRSIKANPADSLLCTALAFNAVHAGMSGKTELVVAMYRRSLVHVPMRQVIASRNQVDPNGALWLNVIASTGQPIAFY